MRARVLRAALVVVVAGLALVVAPGAARAQDPDADPAPEVAIRALSAPTWVGPDAVWVLDLAVEGAPAGAEVEGSLRERIESRDGLNATVFGVLEGDRLATIPGVELDPAAAAPGGGVATRLTLSLGQAEGSAPGVRFLPYDLDPGVYPIEVEVTDDGGETVARQVLYLTRVAVGDERDADDPPLLVAPVLTVGGPPSIGPDEQIQLDDPTIAQVTDVAAGLAVTDDLPATLVPRPETVEALAREPDGSEGAEALTDLTAAADPRQVVDGPYVDVPVDAWVARGMEAELTRQRERGNSVLTKALSRIDSSTWLAREGLTAETAAELWSVGVRSVVLGPDTTARGDDDAGPGPVTVAAGPSRTLEALAADAGLSAALERSVLAGGPRDPVLDDNGLAAELAVIAEQGDGPTGVVLLPPEGWPPDAAAVGRLGAVLQDPLSPVRAVTTADLLDAVPSRGAAVLVPGPLPELGDYPERLGLARARLDSYTSLVGAEDAEVGALGQRLLLSGARTLSPDVQRGYVDTVLATLDTRLGQVQAPDEQTITLTANDADIPLTLRNDLDVPVQVLIELESDTQNVEFRGEGDRIVRTLEPGDQEIRIPIHTRVPGDSPIDITVRTPDGTVALDQVEYTVRSTVISNVGFVLSAGAAAFLLVWWARHWTRARRDRRAAAAAAEAPAPGT